MPRRRQPTLIRQIVADGANVAVASVVSPLLHRGLASGRDALGTREPDRGPDLEAVSLTLLLVRGDPVLALGDDIPKPEQPLGRIREGSVTVLAQVRARLGALNWMEVPADFASLDLLGLQLVALQSLGGKHDLGDPIPRALVIDDAPRSELADREEPGSGEVVVAAGPPPSTGDPGRERKAREAVTRAGTPRSRSSGSCRSRTALATRQTRPSAA